VVPDIRQLAWPKLLEKLTLWQHLHIVPAAAAPNAYAHAHALAQEIARQKGSQR
jgi:hypothetical protein